MEQLQAEIEQRLQTLDPEVELIALERPAAEALRLFIDRPGGVDLDLCERVTNALRDLLADYSLEVSSPGLDRPLTKPEHFRRFVGHTVRVRTAGPVDGRRNFIGRIAAADERAVLVEDAGDRYEIPLDSVRRSNLVPEHSEVTP